MNVVVVFSMGHAMPLPRTSSVPLQINGYFLNRANRRSFSFLRILIRANGRRFKKRSSWNTFRSCEFKNKLKLEH